MTYSVYQHWDPLKTCVVGRWWIPGFEYDDAVTAVEETVFDVNMLIIDPGNVMLFNYNESVFDALERFGIAPHLVPFRHRYFWDGGIHCVTLDLDRLGTQQDYFPERGSHERFVHHMGRQAGRHHGPGMGYQHARIPAASSG